MAHRRAYVDALTAEIGARRRETDEGIATVYLGGGTPSQLPAQEVGHIIDTIYNIYNVEPGAELTLEANPDDVTPEVAALWHNAGINRVSIGVQSLDDATLRAIGRRHTAQEAIEAVQAVRRAGIGNVSIDLMYGLPHQSLEQWEETLERALSLPVEHISAYALTYEHGTRLWQQREKNPLIEATDELSLAMYTLLRHKAKEHGFEHYELSNFARPGFSSRHNSAYWRGTPYLGFGPGAHSYDGRRQRRMNLPELDAYIGAPGEPPHQLETLSDESLFNEAVFTRLRTSEGIDLNDFEKKFGPRRLAYLMENARRHIDAGRLLIESEPKRMRLAPEALFVSDDIVSDLMSLDQA